MLTADEIAYIVEWGKSGNEPRLFLYADVVDPLWDELSDAGVIDIDADKLNTAGLTIAALAEENTKLLDVRAMVNAIPEVNELDQLRKENAKLREAFKQACDLAELLRAEAGSSFPSKGHRLETMRRNRKELINE